MKQEYSEDALNEVNDLLLKYIAKCEENKINMRDCIIFAIASLYDDSNASKSQFMELTTFAIKISDREERKVEL